MFSTLKRVLLVLSLMLIAPSAAVVAQSASIAGVLRDRNGGVIPGVSVTTIPQSGGLLRHTASGSDGSYRFDGLPDGTYRVDFDLRGFELVRRNHTRTQPACLMSNDSADASAPDLCFPMTDAETAITRGPVTGSSRQRQPRILHPIRRDNVL